MIIKEINILSFGCLKDLSLSFTKGLNVVYGKNESGKTTLCSFIEAALYGFKGRDALRSKYIPYGSDSSYGSITFFGDPSPVTLYRRIGSSSKGDKTEIFPTGSSVTGFPESRAAYRAAVCLSEDMSSAYVPSDEIDKRLSNMLLNADESLNAAKAEELLLSARRTLFTPRSSSGRLNRVEEKITALENEKYAALSERTRLASLRERLSAAENELSVRMKKRAEYKSLREENISLNTALDALSDQIESQQKYIASFPEPEGAFSPIPKLSLLKLLPYIICTLVFFIIGLAFFRPCLFISPAPLVFFLLLFASEHKNAVISRKKFLKSVLCTDYAEYLLMKKDKAAASERLSSLLRERDGLKKRIQGFDDSLSRANDDGIIALNDEISRINAALHSSLRPEEDIESDLLYMTQLRTSLKNKIKAIDCAIDAIRYARSKLAGDFTPILSRKISEYMRLIVPGSERSFAVDKSLSMSVLSPFPAAPESCSLGLRREMYVAFRAALGCTLYGADTPLIFDDPFLASDDERTLNIIRLLAKIAEEKQVIVFTNRSNNYFHQLECNYIDICIKNDV